MHMLGFRGHLVTKSRGYYTTLEALRHKRAQWRAERYQPATRRRERVSARAGGLEYLARAI
jgi:hypothetical protein